MEEDWRVLPLFLKLGLILKDHWCTDCLLFTLLHLWISSSSPLPRQSFTIFHIKSNTAFSFPHLSSAVSLLQGKFVPQCQHLKKELVPATTTTEIKTSAAYMPNLLASRCGSRLRPPADKTAQPDATQWVRLCKWGETPPAAKPPHNPVGFQRSVLSVWLGIQPGLWPMRMFGLRCARRQLRNVSGNARLRRKGPALHADRLPTRWLSLAAGSSAVKEISPHYSSPN